ncbi:lytic transglycosylase domain-containing protein [Ferviditalea candida]|uniref:Lytic transglycosylase domain-containing protein n=1 Tax=Ferviditalea candida TaxID=3108399 RepID=A0ABU5ZE24_9BACL|nr:lytic transglycosylase domain-containing protein [Paenibacillaceae bacterium T2]
MKFFQRKSVLAVLLILFVGVLFSNSDWVGRVLYPIKYEQDIRISAANFQLDPFLIAAIIRVESNYKTDLRSKKGAIGLMQIMPQTADWIIEQGQFSDMIRDQLEIPAINIEVGTWYIDSLLKQFDKHIKLKTEEDRIAVIAAAYNAGPGNVANWLDTRQWDGRLATVGQIPFGETRHYIQRILYYYKKYSSFYSEVWGISAEAKIKVSGKPANSPTAQHL